MKGILFLFLWVVTTTTNGVSKSELKVFPENPNSSDGGVQNIEELESFTFDEIDLFSDTKADKSE